MERKPRKIVNLKENQIVTITVPPGTVPRVIEIDAVKEWANRVRLGVASDADVQIGNPEPVRV